MLHTMWYWITSNDYRANCGGLPIIWGPLATALAKLLKSESPIALLLADKAD